jgi:hypothetical protein
VVDVFGEFFYGDLSFPSAAKAERVRNHQQLVKFLILQNGSWDGRI